MSSVATRRDQHRLRKAIVRFGYSLVDRSLIAGSSGDISVRLEDGRLLTPSGSCLGELDPAQLARVDWQGRHPSGDSPFKGAFLHRAIYEERDDAGAIVHVARGLPVGALTTTQFDEFKAVFKLDF